MIIDNGWSVRETEKAVKRTRSNAPDPSSKVGAERKQDPNIKAAETKLMRALNTNVKIIPGKNGNVGKIEIEYYSTDDLDRIYQAILKK